MRSYFYLSRCYTTPFGFEDVLTEIQGIRPGCVLFSSVWCGAVWASSDKNSPDLLGSSQWFHGDKRK